MLLICGMKNYHGQYQQNLCEILRRAQQAATGGAFIYKKSVLKNLANLTGKHLCWSPFLTKLQT